MGMKQFASHLIPAWMFLHCRRKFVLFGLLRDKDGNVIGKDGQHKNLKWMKHMEEWHEFANTGNKPTEGCVSLCLPLAPGRSLPT